MSFKGEENLDIEFGDIIPCDSSEGSYGHVNALVNRDWSSRFSFGCGHSEDWKRQVSGASDSKQLVSPRSTVWMHGIRSCKQSNQTRHFVHDSSQRRNMSR